MNEIYEFVKSNHGRVGVLYGTVRDNIVHIGWSKANVKKDKFDPTLGLKLAMERSKAHVYIVPPQSLVKPVHNFAKRCKRYFKNTTLQFEHLANKS